MNRDVLFSSKTDEWETPQQLFDKLDNEFHFNLDACATAQNAKASRFYTREDDGLSHPWVGTVWCNPPYGRQIAAWVRKGLRESWGGATVVMLLPARTDTKWFHDYILHRAEVRFLRGRLKFSGQTENAPFPSMVVIYRGIGSGEP